MRVVCDEGGVGWVIKYPWYGVVWTAMTQCVVCGVCSE